MDKRDLEQLLSDVAGGSVTPPTPLRASRRLRLPIWALRSSIFRAECAQGAGEVVYGAGKTAEQIAAIIEALRDAGQERILVTRLDAEKASAHR